MRCLRGSSPTRPQRSPSRTSGGWGARAPHRPGPPGDAPGADGRLPCDGRPSAPSCGGSRRRAVADRRGVPQAMSPGSNHRPLRHPRSRSGIGAHRVRGCRAAAGKGATSLTMKRSRAQSREISIVPRRLMFGEQDPPQRLIAALIRYTNLAWPAQSGQAQSALGSSTCRSSSIAPHPPRRFAFTSSRARQAPGSAKSGSMPPTGDEVPFEEIVKGYEITPDRYVLIDPEDSMPSTQRRPRRSISRSSSTCKRSIRSTTTTPITSRRRLGGRRPIACCSTRWRNPARSELVGWSCAPSSSCAPCARPAMS